MQSRLYSFIESIINVLIGYVVALISQIIIFPVFHIKISLKENILIGLFFTAVSIARSYLLRRCFNRIGERNENIIY